jgi:Domain of unknown function (DUF4282)
MSHETPLEAKGFFAGLFDFHFTTFITLKFLRVIYAIVLALILLGGLIFFISSISRGGAGILIGVVVVPLVTMLYLVFARIYMELIALLFRIGENTSLIAQRLGNLPVPVVAAGPPGDPAASDL